MERWAIYIDIEGFSALYPEGNDALWALNKLMLAVYRIGTMVYSESPDRIFAHQVGDGFLIVSDFHEENLERAVSIAIVLMKFITSFGLFARASISEGELGDIVGCYPKEVTDNTRKSDDSSAPMGAGLMTIFPVMGTALINAVGVDKRAPRGPIFSAPSEYSSRLPEHIITKDIEGSQNIAIDWVNTESSLLTEIKEGALLEFPSKDNLHTLLETYIGKHTLPQDWVQSCKTYLGIKNA